MVPPSSVFHENIRMRFYISGFFEMILIVFFQGYDHLANDPAMLYRVETMPGLGW